MATFYQTFSTERSLPKLYTSIVAEGKQSALQKFKDVLHQSAFMHLTFTLFILAQTAISTALFIKDTHSLYTPASFALLFLAIASYALISYYQKNKKLDVIDSITKDFRHYCSLHLSKSIESGEERHLGIAECMRDLAEALHSQELFTLTIHPFKFSKSHIISHYLYFHYSDILYFQEKLLEVSLEQHAYILEDCACSLPFHSSLSKTYATLSIIYKMPKGKHLEKAFSYSNITKQSEFAARLNKYYSLAVEELKIICEISGGEAWTHQELASLYAKFDDSEKEMGQYEILTTKISDDKEILYKLGLLYFKHGKTAKGLTTYNKLRKLDALYAKNLLNHYHFL